MKGPKMIKNIFLLLSLFFSFSFASVSADEIDLKNNELYKAVEKTKHADDAYWLEMESDFGWERMILVFGYYFDDEVCKNTAELYNREYGRNYRCMPVK